MAQQYSEIFSTENYPLRKLLFSQTFFFQRTKKKTLHTGGGGDENFQASIDSGHAFPGKKETKPRNLGYFIEILRVDSRLTFLSERYKWTTKVFK